MIEKTAGERDTLGRLLIALAGLTGIVAVATFGVSAYGGYDTARSQMQLPVILAAAAVLGMDVLAMAGWLALVALVGASWRLRVHAWSVFIIAAAGAIGANLSHAAHRHLSLSGTIGVALAPVAFMLASHLFVVVRRHHVSLRAVAMATSVAADLAVPVTPVVTPMATIGVAIPVPDGQPTLAKPPATRVAKRSPASVATASDTAKRVANLLATEPALATDLATLAKRVGKAERTVRRYVPLAKSANGHDHDLAI